jgi:hypothetical protein
MGDETQKTINFGGKLRFIMSFLFLSTSTAATYIFSALNCTTTIISLECRALNAELQHFILRFNEMSLLCRYHRKRGLGVKGGSKTGWRQGYLTENSNVPKEYKQTSSNWRCGVLIGGMVEWVFGFLQTW